MADDNQTPTGAPKSGAPGGQDDAAASGNYEVIRQRLGTHGKELYRRTEALNDERKQVFGGMEMSVIANERVRSENNCVPRDIVSVDGLLLFGYNVFIGLKSETSVADVFALHRFEPTDDGFDCSAVPLDSAGGFLLDQQFEKDFHNLYRYNRDARLLQLIKQDTKLLAVFQTGASHHDIKVFRWRVDPTGAISYVDDRGEGDYVFPRSHDFEWTELGRPDQIGERHPHIAVLDTLFLDNTGGQLTVRVEDNSLDGEGIYSEPLDDANQALDDALFFYAKLGSLVVLKILPFRETEWRYLVWSERSGQVSRIDEVGLACLQLPEDHGIIFPGGYVLQSGEVKVFPEGQQDLEYKRAIRSPNGEDVTYVFHRRHDGHYALFPYNMIRKEVSTPIHCHGYSLFSDGRLVVFRALSEEPTRVHPMQVWQTPFTSAEHAANVSTGDSFLGKVGNAELVRGISDAFSIARIAQSEEPVRQTFEDLVELSGKVLDAYYWLGHDEVGDLKSEVSQVRRNADLIIAEYEKVQNLKAQARDTLIECETRLENLARELHPEHFSKVDEFLAALTSLRAERGHLITQREIRYIDAARIGELEKQVVDLFDRVSRDCVRFLLGDQAFAPLKQQLDDILAKLDDVTTVAECRPMREQIDGTAEGLDLLGEVVANLQIEDATERTTILEGISEMFAHVNRVRAEVEARFRELAAHEGRAEFGAQFRLLGQSLASALAGCDTPEKCDEEMARVMVQLEELEARFSDYDEFIADLADKRTEIAEAFSAKKQVLLDERQRRGQNLLKAAERTLEGITRRAQALGSADDVNGFFAADAMVLKLRELAEKLSELGDSVKSEELLAKLKTAQQDALRGLRDRLDLYGDGGKTIRLGSHDFSVNTQSLELTMVPREDGISLHLGGSDFYESLDDPEFEDTRAFWSQTVVSETDEVYRAEYLAASVYFDAISSQQLMARLHDAAREDKLVDRVRVVAQDRYDEGYERGIHDSDAALILGKLLSMHDTVGLLRYPSAVRATALLCWSRGMDDDERAQWSRQARNLGRLRGAMGSSGGLDELGERLSARISTFSDQQGLAPSLAAQAGHYLVEELTADSPHFVTAGAAATLKEGLEHHLDSHGLRSDFEADLRATSDDLISQLSMARAWVSSYAAKHKPDLDNAAFEAAVALCDGGLPRETSNALVRCEITGLLGHHPRIDNRVLRFDFDEFLARLGHFTRERVPGYRSYRKLRAQLLEREKNRLRIDELKPRVLSAFVRNQLISTSYLPIIGDNLAKQIGASGAAKRTDLMGLLLLISPPGYGKTTLMEYVANRLGLTFVKINGPSLGHEVKSLDPREAPNATAAQEVDKVNLALEMGNNVMLYVDDIQHTHPEFLQKFISLCDAQRRIEGVWKGRTRTYDLRGKKFCVIMAGNPYTESGETFRIPDMLANRADIYNLGDILHGKGDVFKLSYIENSLTSNPALAPLAGRNLSDVIKLVRMADGEDIAPTELSHGYSPVELGEITAVLSHLRRCQEVLLAVNQQYIQSAAQDERFRTEPPFKLQGSYRNMNKLAEKVVSAMTEEEVDRLIDDHYQGEAQTLTTEAESNLLKLAELRGRLSPEQSKRWNEVKSEYVRLNRLGGGDDDPVTRLTGTLSTLGIELDKIRAAITSAARHALPYADYDVGDDGPTSGN
ncbi:MAG: DNA repair ATPase [Deltaproteobacteria bacterium]|nr:DNA repair ATPase [Deltaproteobacteria bacterium]